MVTQALYEKKTMNIFATPHKSKLGWFNESNDYRILQQNKDASMVIIGHSVSAGLWRYLNINLPNSTQIQGDHSSLKTLKKQNLLKSS